MKFLEQRRITPKWGKQIIREVDMRKFGFHRGAKTCVVEDKSLMGTSKNSKF